MPSLVNPLTIPRADLRYLRQYKEVACLSTDTVGDWVCKRGEVVNGKLRVQRTDPQDIGKMPAIGVLVSKVTPTVGVIQIYGLCEIFTGLDIGRTVYFLGVDGRLSSIQPVIGPGGYSLVQFLGTPVASNVLQINNGGSLNLIKRVG
jgi:hypothetical protein